MPTFQSDHVLWTCTLGCGTGSVPGGGGILSVYGIGANPAIEEIE